MRIEIAFKALDSRLISRVGNLRTLGGLMALGLLLVAGVLAAALSSVQLVGWVLSALFAVWLVISVWLATSWTFGRKVQSVASLADRKVISLGLPGARGSAFKVLSNAQQYSRSLLAEIMILIPPLSRGKGETLSQEFFELEREVGQLVVDSDAFDERWRLMWEHRPSWVNDRITNPPLTLGQSKELAKYVSLRTRQIDYMVQYLKDGNDEPVRHARAWVARQAS